MSADSRPDRPAVIIAHLTDTHILAEDTDDLRGPVRAANLRRVVDDVNRLHPRPDLVLHTGDAVGDGGPREYAHLRSILDRLEPPLYVLPGNHDDREGLRAAFGDAGYLPAGGFCHYGIHSRIPGTGLVSHVQVLGEPSPA